MPDPESNENKWRKNMFDANVKISIQWALKQKADSIDAFSMWGAQKHNCKAPAIATAAKTCSLFGLLFLFQTSGNHSETIQQSEKIQPAGVTAGMPQKRPHVVVTPDF